MAKKLLLKTKAEFMVPLKPDSLLVIVQNKKYANMCHIKTTIKDWRGKNVWYSVMHPAKEILRMYYLCK